MSSPSRTGKDEVVDAVEYCMKGDEIAKIPNSTSKTVLYENHKKYNNARIHRYPDITSLDEHIESLLKENFDGRTSTHSYTDVSGEERKTVTLEIEPPNAGILFAASDNKNINLDDYPEVRNRAMIVSTDASADLTKKVKRRQAEIEVGRYEKKLTEKRRKEIRRYGEGIPVGLYTDEEAIGEVWNLTHIGFAEENPLPDMFPESRMDFGRFNKFIKSVTMFNYEDRMELNNKNREAAVSLLTAPEDVWLAWKVFGEKMVLSALNLEDIDFEILSLLRESSQAMTVAEVQSKMRSKGMNLSEPQARGSLEGMMDKAYLIKDDQSARVKYQPAPFANDESIAKDVTINFQNIVDRTKKDARHMLEEEQAEEYIKQYCEGSGLIATHPFNGKQVNITEQDLGDDLEQQAEKEEEVVQETNPYGSNDDDDHDNGHKPDEPFQGTIG